MVAAALIETQNQSAPFDKLLNQIPQYKWRLEGFPPSSYFQILPTLEDVSKTEILAQRLLGKQRLTTIQVNSLQTLPISLHTALNPEEWNKLELAAQYEHIGQVLKTTLSLKRFLIEKKLSERRIMAFQCGTGFPLPLSNDSDFVLKAYLPYGEGILGYIPKPGVAGHTENDEDILQEKKNPPGMYFYEVTGENGEKITIVAMLGRFHGYEAVDYLFPHLVLATLPRVLKGIGVESMLTTYASGFDVVEDEFYTPPEMGDYGYVLVNSDKSREVELTHPGIGNQKLVGIFGGPFRPGPTRSSRLGLIQQFEAAISKLHPDNNQHKLPRRHATLFYDGPSTPDFENAQEWADVRGDAERILREDRMIDPHALFLIPSKTIAIAHGMSAFSELAAYHQVNLGAPETLFNRVLPFLAIAGCTDGIDPRIGGASAETTHDLVQEVGNRSAAFIAPVISTYFQLLASMTPPIEPVYYF